MKPSKLYKRDFTVLTDDETKLKDEKLTSDINIRKIKLHILHIPQELRKMGVGEYEISGSSLYNLI